MKLKNILTVGLLSVFSIASHAEILMWSADGQDAYTELDWTSWYSRSRFQTDESGNEIPYNKKIELVGLKNSSSVLTAFADFNTRKVQGKSLSGKVVSVTTVGDESCQCVAFVKTMTNYAGSTSNWREGQSLATMDINNLAIGTSIATFNRNGDYDFGHTAIVVGKSGRGDWIEVIDQNWSPIVDSNFASRERDIGTYSPNCTMNSYTLFADPEKKGFIMQHRIYFDNSKSKTYNANNYSIIEIN